MMSSPPSSAVPPCAITDPNFGGDSRARLVALNRTCRCWPVDQTQLRSALPAQVRAVIGSAQAHLFADTGVFIDTADLYSMQQQIAAIESVAKSPGFLNAVTSPGRPPNLLTGPQSATRGVLMGYDFHLAPQGPRLIEVNTNAGGAFLVQHMTQQLGLAQPVGDGKALARALVDMFNNEWRLAGRTGPIRSIAIVDDTPPEQYLYSDMLLAAESLREHIEQVVIVDPSSLRFDGKHLRAADRSIDMVYNRLTDFGLSSPPSAALLRSWAADAVVVTPGPHHHARLARKSNLALLSDSELLTHWGVSAADRDVLAGIPKTVCLDSANAPELWARRKQLFFKPVAGFGGRAAYRGAKLTKRVWQQLVDEGGYVAQELVTPAERVLGENRLLKFDVRVYTYAGASLALVARVYQGQTTNFRTAGGGFAPVGVV